MARQDDRPVGADLRQERLERRRDVAIGQRQRAVGVGCGGQERAERRLAIARRPDRADAVERARLPAQEQVGAGVRLRVGERRVPMVAREVGGRVDEEDPRAVRRGAGVVSRWRPLRRIALQVRPRRPQPRPGIVGRGQPRLGMELRARDQCHAHQLRAVQSVRERAGDHEDDQDGKGIEELAGQAALPERSRSLGRGAAGGQSPVAQRGCRGGRGNASRGTCP